MPGQRIVLLRSSLPDGRQRVGSGTLIGGRLVLTAAHVVFGDIGAPLSTIQVALAQESVLATGAVLWPERYEAVQGSGGLDAALVEIIGREWSPPDRLKTPVRFGRLTGRAAGVPCEAIGYPRVLREPDGLRVEDHLSGVINPAAGLIAGRYDIQIVGAAPIMATGPDEHPPWAGASGAGVFVHGLLTAVLVVDLPGFPHDRLTAVPMHRILAVPVLGAILASHGILTAASRDIYSAELAELFDNPRLSRRLSPAALLRADEEVVSFRGREIELNDHMSWCRKAGRELDVRLLVGPGGQGKTRLARQLVHQLADLGWVTGFLRGDTASQSVDLSPIADTSALAAPGVLLVVDYAETRSGQLTRLLSLLSNASDTAPIRVLLLARTAGGWWRDLQLRDRDGVLTTATQSALPPLDDTLPARRRAYDEAVTAFAQALLAVDADTDWQDLALRVAPPQDLDADKYGTPLTLQMSALLALLQADDDMEAESGVQSPNPAGLPLERLILDHEQRYWEQTAAEYGLSLGPLTLATVVASATVLGSATHREALTTLRRLPGLRDQLEDRLFVVDRWLCDLYPASAGQHWGKLEPDRIAEHQVGALTAEDPALLDVLLGEATDEQAVAALAMLRRAATHQRHLTAQLREVIARRRSRLERAAATLALMAEDPSLSFRSAMNTIYEAVSSEDRQITWEQWLEPEGKSRDGL